MPLQAPSSPRDALMASQRHLHRRHPQLHWSVDPTVIIVVAEYVSDDECHWKYRAKVVTPDSLLTQEGAPPDGCLIVCG